jgi:CHAT domain-containing protein
LRSGLRLADGFLDVADTFRRVRLTADLVTLSGCETGLGHLRTGDEVIGLVRAWLYAGSPSVLVSLWTVDDFSTQLLMQEFYASLTDLGPARAISQAQAVLGALTTNEIRDRALGAGFSEREAQAEVTRLTRLSLETETYPLNHPYFYAPFVLHGRT